MSEWVRHDSMRAGKTHIVDDRGHRIDMVRGYREEPGGLRIRALHPVDGGKKCVLAGDDVVEFEAFVPGATVVVGELSAKEISARSWKFWK